MTTVTFNRTVNASPQVFWAGQTYSLSDAEASTYTGDGSAVAAGGGGGGGGSSGLQPSNNLSDLASASAARGNLGLGTAATQASSAFDASGAAAAVQTNLGTHTARTDNPHSTTASQVGITQNLNSTDSPTFAMVTASSFVGDGSGLTGISSGGGYAADIGDGSTTDVVVTHSLGTRDVSVTVRQTSGTYAVVYPGIQMTTTDTITLTFTAAPTTGQFRVIIVQA